MTSTLHHHPDRFRRELLPAIDAYCERNGLTWRSGRGREQRWDCPLGAHSHRGNLAVNVEKGLWHCLGGCGAGDVLELHQRITGLGFVDAARELGALGHDSGAPASRPAAPPRAAVDDAEEAARAARKRRRAAEVWSAARPIEPGTPAHAYLVCRGCLAPPRDGDLRWSARLQLFGFDGPALVGRMTATADASRAAGLHLTWLALYGGRWRRTERRYLGPKGGAVVRLWPDEAVDTALGVAEGIETALGAAHAFRPVWAAMDAGNLAGLPVLDGIESLTVFADNDASGAGQRAAGEAARRWVAAGRESRVILADQVGTDVLDEVTA